MKKQEKGRTRIKPISRMLWFAFPALALPFLAFAEINTSFHHRALSGVTQDMGSNVTLALSVEFPTAGAAYSDIGVGSTNKPVFYSDVMKTKYLGYFDNEKCYRYVADSSDPTGAQAFSNSGYVQNAGMDNAYWFRPINKWNDGVNFKYITNAKEYFEPVRKAEKSGDFIGVCNGADEFSGNFMNWLSMSAIDIFRQALTGGNRAIGVNTNQDNYTSADTENFTTIRRAKVQNGQNDRYSMNKSVILTTDQIKMFLPHSYAINAGTVLAQGNNIRNNSLFLYRGAGYVEWNRTLQTNGTELFFRNHDFGIDIRRLVNNNSGVNFYAPISGRIMPYQVNVMVCKEGLLESNCVKQANGKYKPEGLIQKNARKMRFSTLGYANIAGNGVNGGLLRSEMAYVLDPRTDSSEVAPKFLPEINPTTGQFNVNPDASLGEKNSGTINYLNKFGDLGGYKTNDPVAELYYTALRYLRNKDFPSQYVPFTRNNGTGGNIPGGLTDLEKDNFPAIVNWKNPLVVYPDGATSVAIDKDSANVCRNNYLILIGDTNTHDDKDLPNGWGSKNVPDEQIDTQALLQEIFNQEGFSGNLNQNFGSQNSPAGFPALAYWARTNPLQPGFNKRLKTFAIDVVESDNYKTGGNTYYLAAKYGGFDEEGVSGSNKNNVPDILAEWMRPYDKVDAFTNAGKETPKTFAVANSPEAMVKALTNAFAGSTTADKPSSTGLSSASNGSEITEGDSVLMLQSAYRDTTSTDKDGNPIRIFAGDVLALRTSFVGNQINVEEAWSADEQLNSAYHNGGWTRRKVYTRTSPDGNVIPFNTANASILSSSLGVSDTTYAGSLIAYTLGDPTNEGSDKAFRLRKDHLMGTVINSQVIPVTPVKETTVNTPKGSCTYPASANATTRDLRYVAAANDGMTYILGENGEELASYLPSKALPRLADYAKHDYQHFFLNDGSGAHKEICLSAKASDDTTNIAVDGARSIVVGSMGRGGNAVYAIDLTQPAPTASSMLWEFADPALGMSIYAPVITYDKTGAPIVIVSGGYNPEAGDEGYIFVLRLDKPANKPWVEEAYNEDEPWVRGNWYKIKLGKAGVGELFGFNNNKDAYDTQAVYAGDLEGYLWKIVQNDKGRFVVAYDGAPIFQADAPIVGAPYVETVYPNPPRIVFATGRYFDSNDVPTTTRPVQNYAYGLYEGSIAADAKPQANGAMIANSEILHQEINATPSTETYVNAAGETVSENFYTSTNHNIDTNIHKGWRLQFPENWLSVDKSLILNGMLGRFSAINPLDNFGRKELCGIDTGSTYIINVNINTGGQYNKALYDTNGDGQINKEDTMYVATTMGSGQHTRVNAAVQNMLRSKDPNKPNNRLCTTSLGDMGIMEVKCQLVPNKLFTVRRLSWREIF